MKMRQARVAEKANQTSAFTLTELLLVVIILGILSVLVVPQYFPKVEKAKVAEAVSILNAVRQGEKNYWLERGNYLVLTFDSSSTYTEWNKIGLDNPNAIATSRNWSYQVLVDNSNPDPQQRE